LGRGSLVAGKDELLAIAPPVDDGQSVPVGWETFETSLGFILPADYKWLIDTYGPGKFGNFLYVLQPYSESKYVRLDYCLARGREILRELGHNEEHPYPVDELLPVAATDNGDTIYWVTRPLDAPNLWTITGNEARDVHWPTFDGGIVDFLVAVLTGRRYFEIFPRSFPSNGPEFSRYSVSRRRRS
jgi:hypothetical protein